MLIVRPQLVLYETTHMVVFSDRYLKLPLKITIKTEISFCIELHLSFFAVYFNIEMYYNLK